MPHHMNWVEQQQKIKANVWVTKLLSGIWLFVQKRLSRVVWDCWCWVACLLLAFFCNRRVAWRLLDLMTYCLQPRRRRLAPKKSPVSKLLMIFCLCLVCGGYLAYTSPTSCLYRTALWLLNVSKENLPW